MMWTKDWYNFRDSREDSLEKISSQNHDVLDIIELEKVSFPIKVTECRGDEVLSFYDSNGKVYDYLGEDRPVIHATHVLDDNRDLFIKVAAPENDTQPIDVKDCDIPVVPESEGDELFRLINSIGDDVKIGNVCIGSNKRSERSQAKNVLIHLRKLHTSRVAEVESRIKNAEAQLKRDREILANLG